MLVVTREPSPRLAEAERTYREPEPVDVELARRQHRDFEEALRGLGMRVVEAPAAPASPDGAFVEDVAVVLEEVAVLARPGLPGRRREVGPVGRMLAEMKPVRRIEAPATLEGGDVLRVDRDVWVGVSPRTNARGAAQLQSLLAEFGYSVHTVPVRGAVHLKTACTHVGRKTVLCNPEWVDTGSLEALWKIRVDDDEPWAANTLLAGETVVMPEGFPRTADRLRESGRPVVEVDVSEFQKAEGGVSCLALVVDPGP
jgi:dimethylargininase